MSLIEMEESVILSKLGILCVDEICRSCLTNKMDMRSLFLLDSSSIFDAKYFLNRFIGLQVIINIYKFQLVTKMLTYN